MALLNLLCTFCLFHVVLSYMMCPKKPVYDLEVLYQWTNPGLQMATLDIPDGDAKARKVQPGKQRPVRHRGVSRRGIGSLYLLLRF